MKKRRIIRCKENIAVNICNIKEGDVFILNILDNYTDAIDLQTISDEAKRLSNELEKDLGYKVPVLVLAGNMTFNTMTKEEIQKIIDNK